MSGLHHSDETRNQGPALGTRSASAVLQMKRAARSRVNLTESPGRSARTLWVSYWGDSHSGARRLRWISIALVRVSCDFGRTLTNSGVLSGTLHANVRSKTIALCSWARANARA